MNALTGMPRDKKGEVNRQFVGALARGLDILRAFDPGDRFFSDQEIAQRTGLNMIDAEHCSNRHYYFQKKIGDKIPMATKVAGRAY